MASPDFEVSLSQEEIDMSQRLHEKASQLNEVDSNVAKQLYLGVYDEVCLPKFLEDQERRIEIARSPEFQLFIGTPVAF